jgi:hypothetical protein
VRRTSVSAMREHWSFRWRASGTLSDISIAVMVDSYLEVVCSPPIYVLHRFRKAKAFPAGLWWGEGNRSGSVCNSLRAYNYTSFYQPSLGLCREIFHKWWILCPEGNWPTSYQKISSRGRFTPGKASHDQVKTPWNRRIFWFISVIWLYLCVFFRIYLLSFLCDTVLKIFWWNSASGRLARFRWFYPSLVSSVNFDCFFFCFWC